MFGILCIFTPRGKTFTFLNGAIQCSNESALQFSYTAMSDGKSKVATFPKANICGWSITPASMDNIPEQKERRI